MNFNIAGSESGLINGPILKTVVEKLFIEELNEYRAKHGLTDRWALLLLDNHSSRMALADRDFFDRNKLRIMYIPPHSSALLQPLDLGPNLIFKKYYAKFYVHDETADAKDTRNQQMEAASLALTIATCAGNIKPAWRRAGLWPIDMEEVKGSKMIRKPLQIYLQQKKAKGVKHSSEETSTSSEATW
jgi:hypothetical protein